MTIKYLASQLHDLSLGGYFNGQKVSKQWLESYISKAFQSQLKLGNRLVMEIALPDGRWLFTINRFSDSADGFDYTIPETREQEARIRKMLAS